MAYQILPGERDSGGRLDDLMHFELFGIRLLAYDRLCRHGFISAECHRLVTAAVIVKQGMSAGQAQAMLGDHMYVIGARDSGIAKVGRSGT